MRLTGYEKGFRTSLPIVVFLLYLPISLAPDLRLAVPEWIGLTAVIIILLSLVLFFSPSIQHQWSAGFILTVAAILRGLFLWRSPELSDDLYRYLFDGLMLVNGRSPYAMAPADAVTAMPLLSALAGHINHPELPTIYPPSAQLVFAAGAVIGNIAGMKLVLVLADLAGCALILGLLDRLRLPRDNAVIYAWHPLPVMEIGASGHIDAAAVMFTFLALFFLLPKGVPGSPARFSPVQNGKGVSGFARPALSVCAAGISFSLAVLTKWTPLIFLPGLYLLTASHSRKYAGLGLLATAAVMIGLFWPEVQRSFNTLSIYVANWEFSGFVFRCLRSATGSGKMARLIIAGTFLAAVGMIYCRYFISTRPASLSSRRGVFHCLYATAFLFLFLTPTLHPWYALYLAAFLPFAAGPAGIVLSWSVFLAYRVVILYGMTGQWIENDFIPFLIIIAPAGAFAAGVLLRASIHNATGSDKPAPATS